MEAVINANSCPPSTVVRVDSPLFTPSLPCTHTRIITVSKWTDSQ